MCASVIFKQVMIDFKLGVEVLHRYVEHELLIRHDLHFILERGEAKQFRNFVHECFALVGHQAVKRLDFGDLVLSVFLDVEVHRCVPKVAKEWNLVVCVGAVLGQVEPMLVELVAQCVEYFAADSTARTVMLEHFEKELVVVWVL